MREVFIEGVEVDVLSGLEALRKRISTATLFANGFHYVGNMDAMARPTKFRSETDPEPIKELYRGTETHSPL